MGAIILAVSQVSHSDFGSTLFVAPVSHGPLGFCNLARCTTAVAAGLKIRAYDRVDLYNHYTYIPVQKLRDIQREMLQKRKLLFRRILQQLLTP